MFDQDLEKAILYWIQAGEQIILCIDLNEEFTCQNGPLYSMLTESLPLVNVLTHKHPNLAPPATHDTGSRSVDAILVTPNLTNIQFGGWLEFSSSIGGHCPVYIDVKIEDFIGKSKHEIASSRTRRLQIDNHRAMTKYLKCMESNFFTTICFPV